MLVLAGAGIGSVEGLTLEVYREILKADRVIAFGRIAGEVKRIRDDIIEVSRTGEVIDQLNHDGYTLLLASGDPLFFGIYKLLERQGVEVDRVLPGVSSMQGLFSRIKIPWSDFSFLSFHGRKMEFTGKLPKKIFFLTDKENSPGRISKALEKEGYRGVFYGGFDLGSSSERIIEGKIGDEIEDQGSLGVMAVIVDD